MATTSQSVLRTREVERTQIPCYVFDSGLELAGHVGQIVMNLIRERQSLGRHAVLGLPTGSTPVGIYRELIRLHKEEGLSFANVVTFNLDEYFGLSPDDVQSFHHWMHDHLFDHIDMRPENIHLPDGRVSSAQANAHCQYYEALIAESGGIDLLMLGIGQNGHIGFNEPFSIRNGRTRLCTLDPVTRRVAANLFFGQENVPTHALTMGMGTILDARKILLMALGEHKAEIVREATEGSVTDRVPASLLQDHGDATVLLDEAAAGKLTSCATPWVTANVEWTTALQKRAVLWLAQQTGKALLKLDEEDFRQHNLHQLLRHHGPVHKLAQRVFGWMMDTIHRDPAGAQSKRIICFSPHPDDDVISMGGTLIRLVENRHDVHVAYMTSGNIAVFDHDALRIADMVTEYNRLFGIDDDKSQLVETTVAESLQNKRPGQHDIEAVQRIKGLIRWSEAKAAAMEIGCGEQNLHFLDLPFYRTGLVAKHPVGQDDVAIIRQLIDEVDPQQIYVAGDLSDPHGTHRMCADAIFRALADIESEKGSRPEVMLYRGAWQEYELHQIEVAVPLSPADMELKRSAIFMHESQKDEALFPGSDPREFWQRAEDRNKGTSATYNQIGLPEFFALEAFVRWDGIPI